MILYQLTERQSQEKNILLPTNLKICYTGNTIGKGRTRSHPLAIPGICYIKNIITRPNIEVGASPYYDDASTGGNTVVGNDVWMGQHVTVLPGVHIGDGAIIGANSVVSGNTPPYAIAAGKLCCVIRPRFALELTGYLLELRWCDWDAEKIFRNPEILCSGDLTWICSIVP